MYQHNNPAKNHVVTLGVWLLLTLLLLLLTLWLYRATATIPKSREIQQVSRFLDRSINGLKAEMFWLVAEPAAHQVGLPPSIDALLLADEQNVLAFKTRQVASSEEKQLLSSMLSLLQSKRQFDFGVVFWREQVYLVAMEISGQRNVLVAVALEAWLRQLAIAPNIKLALSSHSRTDAQGGFQVAKPLPAVISGEVFITASLNRYPGLSAFPWFLSLLLCGGVAGISTWSFYYRPVWRRYAELVAQLKQIILTGDFKRRLKTTTNHRFNDLAVQINSILSSLEYCYSLLAKTNMITTELLHKVDRQGLLDETMGTEKNELKTSLDAVSRLDQALESHSMETCIQPVFNRDKHTIVSYEVTSRWLDGELGLMPVVAFSPMCEQAGLLGKLTREMLSNAFIALRALQSKHGDQIRITLHLGAAQFSRNSLLPLLTDLTEEEQDLLSYIDFDIKESAITHDFEDALDTTNQLRLLGAGIRISDYGLSRYSLMYLQRIPVNSIKLARAFSERLAMESKDIAFIEGVVRFASGLGIRVVLEQLDDDTHLDGISQELPFEYQGVSLGAMTPLELALAS